MTRYKSSPAPLRFQQYAPFRPQLQGKKVEVYIFITPKITIYDISSIYPSYPLFSNTAIYRNGTASGSVSNNGDNFPVRNNTRILPS